MDSEDTTLCFSGRSVLKDGALYGVLPRDRSKIKCISYYVMSQCIAVFVGVATVLNCVWKPTEGKYELEILCRIMYLYDTDACGTTTSLKQFRDLQLSNDTYGLAIRPIRHQPAVLNVVTKLSGKTRTYLKLSLALHVIWLTATVIMWVFAHVPDLKVLKIVLRIFLYCSFFMVIFDFCLAVVYMAHIQQALTKAMVIRYSGWGMVPGNMHLDDFGGWVPLMAAAAWLRGIVLFFLNIYVCSFVRRVIRNIRGKEVKSKIDTLCNIPFPDANYNVYNQKLEQGTLHFRAGEPNKFERFSMASDEAF